MKIYPKRLKNMKSLQQEKKKLRRQKMELEAEEWMSLNGLLGAMKGEGGGGESLLNMLPVSNPAVNVLIRWLKGRLKRKSKSKSQNSAPDSSSGKHQRSFLSRLAREFIGGYLKWKAIELSYKGIKLIIKMRRGKDGEDD